MMLRHAQRVAVIRRQVWLQILLDVMPVAECLQLIHHPKGVILPVPCLCDRQVIDAADLVEVNKLMRCIDDGKAGLDVDGRLQADPREDAAIVEGAQRLQTVAGKRSAALPLLREAIIEAG
jgi:hypothetical protein